MVWFCKVKFDLTVVSETKRKNSLKNFWIVSLGGTSFSFFLFFGLLIFSGAVFAVASDERTSDINIFLDADQDGLSNDEEKLYGTDPFSKDTDGDGYSDGIEIESGYDPLRPAPGDKIVYDAEPEPAAIQATDGRGGDNLTQKVSKEIESALMSADGDVSLEEVDRAVANLLGDSAEVVLPEIDIESIKVRKGPAESLPEAERKGLVRKDVMEYITVIAYIFANNAPGGFKTQAEAESLAGGLTDNMAIAFSSGNLAFLQEVEKQGEKILEETENIEVPESMLGTHVKALQFAKYASELSAELEPSEADPLSQIAVLSKVQGLLGAAHEFSLDVSAQFAELGITEIPLEF